MPAFRREARNALQRHASGRVVIKTVRAARRAARAHIDTRSDERFLSEAYLQIMKRPPSSEDLASYHSQLQSGVTRDDALVALALSDPAVIRLDYSVVPTPRWGWGKPSHPGLLDLLARAHERYKEWIGAIATVTDSLAAIGTSPASETVLPSWVNGWIPALDSAALYAMLTAMRPATYLEVGSGHSTMFARRAILDHDLPTKIVSIDPYPRAEIDRLVDTPIRRSLEEADVTMFDQLQRDDVVFFDGSHRCFPNSDVTVMFTEILPRLRDGVYVQIHDIWLPDDYPPDQANRVYSEQYLLATMLLAGDMGYEVVLPCWYVSQHDTLTNSLAPLWQRLQQPGFETHGCSFWMRKRAAPTS